MINVKKLMYIFLISAVVIILAVIISIFGFIYYLDHSENSDYTAIYFSDVVLDENSFSIHISYPSSAIGLTRYTYEIEGTNLYLTLYSGLPSEYRVVRGDMDIRIEDEALAGVEKVYFKDKKVTELIYDKNEEHLTDINKTVD